MSNKIIKISIVLIFILFSAGLFNFCFAAVTVDSFNFVDMDVPECTSDNFDFSSITDGHDRQNLIDNATLYINRFLDGTYNNYIYFKSNDNWYLTFLHPSIINTSSDIAKMYTTVNTVCFKPNGCLPIKYNVVKKKWELQLFDIYINTSSNLYSFNVVPTNGITVAKSSNFICYTDNTFTDILIDSSIYNKPSIDMKTVQTGTRTGHVEFTKKNWDSPHMYYVKDDMDELVRLLAEEELSVTHPQVKHYDGPIDVEYGEYVLGMLFDNNGNMVFSKISDGVTINYDNLTDITHGLYLDKENEDTYYLSIHGYQDGDYVEICNLPQTNDGYSSHKIVIGDTLEYNGLQIGQLYETALGHRNRKIKLTKNGITYFYLYDSMGNLVNSVVLNSSNYYSGEDFNFDVELSYGQNRSYESIGGFSIERCSWVKVKPIISVPSLSNYELYFRISDYGNIGYYHEENRNIFLSHDNQLKKIIGFDTENSSTKYVRIDNLIYDYFYIGTNQDGNVTFSFDLQLRSKSGQIIQTKSFTVNLSDRNPKAGTISSSTDGKDDTYVRDSNELAGTVGSSNKFSFDGLDSSTSLSSLKVHLSDMLDNSIGFFGLMASFLLLLPTWISSLLYFFLFGIIVITLYRFVRGA